MVNKRKVKKVNSNSLKEENSNLKYELKELKRAKKEKTHNILMGIYIIAAITLFVNTESGYVFAGSIVLGVVFHTFLNHVLEIEEGQ